MASMRTFKADLHVHSSHSNKPTYWAMRKFNCPESYTSPDYLYHTARSRGMDYVTISDHNSINGALEIAHLPGVFVSSEITSYFPENSCKVHVVVLNITESQFRRIIELRKNIYEMVAYLHGEGIAHFMAHPLYAQNDKLTTDIIEKALVLFTTFEVKNGCRARRFNAFTEQVVASLTLKPWNGLPIGTISGPTGPHPGSREWLGARTTMAGCSSAGPIRPSTEQTAWINSSRA
jgi:predicted metal-dependent phosphoesterase TrpH